MADTTSSGGMFSKLINPDTAKPKINPPRREEKSISGNKDISIKHPPAPSKQPIKIKNALKFEKDIKPRRRQISAYLSHEQLKLLKQLYFKLNEGDSEIEKSEIVGLAIEVLSKILGTQVPKYSSIYKVREYLDTQILRYLSTQVPKNLGT